MVQHRMKRRLLAGSIAVVAAVAMVGCTQAAPSDSTGEGAADEEVIVGLITKTNTNPYYIAMQQGAEEAADRLGMTLLQGSGQSTTDIAGQIQAMENMITAGAKGILVSSSDSTALLPAIERARDQGIIVLAVDAPVDPADAVDALFATDNFEAGFIIGQYAAALMEGQEMRIAMLDDQPGSSAGVLRHNGFLAGIGVDVDASETELVTDPRVVCSGDTSGDLANGQTVMENCLQRDPSINMVYSINEPAGIGAARALEAAGKSDVPIVSVDGGCTGVQAIESGQLVATAQQYPLRMAVQGLEAIAAFLETGERPSGYVNTGVNLITANPVDGVTSEDIAYGLENCWG